MDAKTYITKQSFCVLPWTGVYVQPDGQVRNCAVTEETLGNINDADIESILRGPQNENIKHDMLNDVMHSRCGLCYRLGQNQKKHLNQISNRVWYLKQLKNSDKALYDDPKNFDLKVLDLRWKNTCNFACVYCGPDLSSRWAKEMNMLQRIDSDSPVKSSDYIYNNLHNVKHVYLAGGEPLLIQENLVLLEKLLAINPDVDLRINTNLSVVNNDIYNLIKQFKNVHWTVSVDNTSKQFEYLRYGGDWNVFVKNLEQLSKDFTTINFNLVWCILSSHSIFDCMDYLINTLGYHENTIIVNPLENPDWQNVNNLPDRVLDELAAKIKGKIEQSNPTYCLNNSLQLMLNFIDKGFEKDLQKTVDELKIIDQRRNLDSTTIFPDLYKCLE